MTLAQKLKRLRLQDVIPSVSMFGGSLINLFIYYADLLTTSKKKADHLKAEIRSKVTEMLGTWELFYSDYVYMILHHLVDITGNPRAMMQYTRYEEEIVHRYGVELQGWTYEKITNPSLFSSSLPPLVALRDALVAGTCKFVKLTAAERKEREAAYMTKVASGEIEPRKRKRRSDAGVRKRSKRARKEDGATNDSDDDEDDDDDERDAPHAPKSQELIEDSDAE